MNWLNQVTDIMKKYDSSDPAHIAGSVDAVFDRFTRSAPSSTVAQGLAEAFRSPETPPFASMLGRLFERSAATQKTNVLNTLIAGLGPTVVSRLLDGTARTVRRKSSRSEVAESPRSGGADSREVD
jgi:hypothetical protein